MVLNDHIRLGGKDGELSAGSTLVMGVGTEWLRQTLAIHREL